MNFLWIKIAALFRFYAIRSLTNLKIKRLKRNFFHNFYINFNDLYQLFRFRISSLVKTFIFKPIYVSPYYVFYPFTQANSPKQEIALSSLRKNISNTFASWDILIGLPTANI